MGRRFTAYTGGLRRLSALAAALNAIFGELARRAALNMGEYLGSAAGVGYLILQAEGTLDVNTVIAGIFVLTACALILDSIVGVIEKRLMRWQPKSGETEKL